MRGACELHRGVTADFKAPPTNWLHSCRVRTGSFADFSTPNQTLPDVCDVIFSPPGTNYEPPTIPTNRPLRNCVRSRELATSVSLSSHHTALSLADRPTATSPSNPSHLSFVALGHLDAGPHRDHDLQHPLCRHVKIETAIWRRECAVGERRRGF